MDDNKEFDTYIDDLISKLERLPEVQVLGEEMQMGTRLAKTARGARTNARIEASQKKETFDETGIEQDELDEVENDVTNELFNRALENLFGE